LAFSLLSLCTSAFHHFHGFTLFVFENFQAFVVSRRVNQMKVNIVDLRLKDWRVATQAERSCGFDLANILLDDCIIALLSRDGSSFYSERWSSVKLSKPGASSGSCDSMKRRVKLVIKLINTSPGAIFRSGAITSNSIPFQPFGSKKVNVKLFDPPCLLNS